VFLNYILHWGALRFYALLKGALTEKSLRKAGLFYVLAGFFYHSNLAGWLITHFSVV